MKILRIALALGVFVLVAASVGCFQAPLELKTALQRQAHDLQQINTAYSQNIDALLTALEKLQLEYVKVAEDQVRSKSLYEGKIGERATSVSNPDLLIIRVKTDKKINEYFSQKREQIHKNFADKRKEFLKLQQSIDNATQVNLAMSDYVDSLIRLRKAQDTFGKTLLTRISNVVPVPAISSQVIDEVIKVTDQEVDTFFKDNSNEPQTKEVKTGGQ
jgi:hypothetical protein